MSPLLEVFEGCYLVHFSVNPDNTMEVYKAKPLKLITSKYGAEFLGSEGTGIYGIPFAKNATHIGLFDLSNTDKPVRVFDLEFNELNKGDTKVIKARGCYVIIRRGDKNFKFMISQYKTQKESRQAKLTTPKIDPQTKKASSSLKNIKYKKA